MALSASLRSTVMRLNADTSKMSLGAASSGLRIMRMSCVAQMGNTRVGMMSGGAYLGLQLRGQAITGQYFPQQKGLIPTVWTLPGKMQVLIPPADIGAPPTLAANTAWQSQIINAAGLSHVSFAVTSDQGGLLSLNRYVNPDGSAPLTAYTTAVTSAACYLDNHDGNGFSSFSVGITNSSASVMHLSSYALLLAQG